MTAAQRTALVSFAAAVGLMVAKLAVGLLTGSLALLAEAAHSAMDAVAALVTVYAVTVADRPPDREHQYGHGKAQNLASLAEAAILAVLALVVVWESVARLREGGPAVDAAPLVFAFLVAVLGVDAGRAFASFRLGQREHSPALIANAWHFASDFAGTLAVLAGFALVAAGVEGGDSLAALFVAGLVLVAAARLASRNADALMDRAPAGLAASVHDAVGRVPGVREVRSVRVREAGGDSFADVVITLPRLTGLERSHDTMDRVEDAVREHVDARAHVTVHVEPATEGERANERVAAAALRVPGVVETHNITVLEDAGGRAITLHARLDEAMPLRQARPIVERLKAEIRREFGVARVYTHVEPFAPDAMPARDVSGDEPALQRAALEAVRSLAPDAGVVVYRQGPRLLVVAKVPVGDGASVRDAHVLASRVEDAVRERLADVDDVIVEAV
jgi:cation diffusion facilitator family transporter